MKRPYFAVLAIIAALALLAAGLFGSPSRASTPAQGAAQPKLMWPDLVLPARTFFAPVSPESGGRKVFAHFMLCCGAFGSDVAAFRQDIAMARSMGIDGFALNAGQWFVAGKDGRKTIPSAYKAAAQAMFAAADEQGGAFTLFFSADMSTGLDDADITDMIGTFASRPSYLKVAGRPVLSAYAASRAPGGAAYWGALRKRLGLFLVPYTFPAVAHETPGPAQVATLVSQWKDAVDGMFYFGAAGLPFRDAKPSIIASSEAYADALRRAGKLYMAPYSPYYWGDRQPRRRYFEYEGGRGTAAQWQSIIKVAKPQWVEIVTWNDPIESFIQPVDAHWSQTRYYDVRVPFPDRRGYAELLRYYIAWFKTGQEPRITRDALFWFYRTQPMADAAPSRAGRGKAAHPYQFERPRAISANARDALYLTTALTAPAELRVSSGGKVTRHKVPKGIWHLTIPFVPGAQHFTLVRNGTRILQGSGAEIAARFDYYNYWPASGYIVK